MQIQNFKPALPHEGHIAEFSVEIPTWCVTFHKYKVRRSKQGNLFIAPPSFSQEGSGGEKKWSSFIEFTKEKKGDFDKKVMELVKPLIEQMQVKTTEQMFSQRNNMEDIPF